MHSDLLGVLSALPHVRRSAMFADEQQYTARLQLSNGGAAHPIAKKPPRLTPGSSRDRGDHTQRADVRLSREERGPVCGGLQLAYPSRLVKAPDHDGGSPPCPRSLRCRLFLSE